MYLFLLGRDYKLSILEILSYFKFNNISYSLITSTNNYIIFKDFPKDLDFNKVILDVSGITRIYKIFYVSEKLNNSFLNKFDKEYTNKFNYSVSYTDASHNHLQIVLDILKEQFKSEKIKAVYKKPKKHDPKIENTIVNPNNYFSYSLDKGFELFLTKNKNLFYIGYAIACTSLKDIILKDTKRPEQRELYSTSFRLVKIMINLLSLKKGKRIYDPFCGLGNFLIEGLSKGYDVVGVDKDREMVVKSKKNVSWAIDYFKLKNNSSILHGDSSKLKVRADAVVFEPYMGPFISKLLNYTRAKEISDSLTKLYFDVFKNLSENLKPKTRVVCILPEFKTYDNKIIKITNDVFLKNNFVFYDLKKINKDITIENPIFYTTPNDSKINRYIYILERK